MSNTPIETERVVCISTDMGVSELVRVKSTIERIITKGLGVPC